MIGRPRPITRKPSAGVRAFAGFRSDSAGEPSSGVSCSARNFSQAAASIRFGKVRHLGKQSAHRLLEDRLDFDRSPAAAKGSQ